MRIRLVRHGRPGQVDDVDGNETGLKRKKYIYLNIHLDKTRVKNTKDHKCSVKINSNENIIKISFKE
jgi:hypothetical protein